MLKEVIIRIITEAGIITVSFVSSNIFSLILIIYRKDLKNLLSILKLYLELLNLFFTSLALSSLKLGSDKSGYHSLTSLSIPLEANTENVNKRF